MDALTPRQSVPAGGKSERPNVAAMEAEKPERIGDLAGSLNVLRRRWRIVAAVTLLGTIICLAVVFSLTPRYTAEADVMLEPRKTQVIDMQAVLSGLPADNAVVRSELEVLKSAGIALEVVRRTKLADVPEFNPRLEKASVLDTLRQPVNWALAQFSSLFGAPLPSDTSPQDPRRREQLSVMRRLQNRTEILNDGRSYVLKIRVESESPQLSAKLANAYADAYLDAQLEAKFEAVRRANNWLNEHLTDLKSKAEATDRAVETFRTQHHLSQMKGETITGQQIAELNSQLILAGADRAQKESNLKQIQDQIRSGGVAAAAQVLASPLIQRLREQESALVTKEAELATRYKPAHPEMINIKAQVRDLEQKIKVEIDKIVRGFAGEVASARAKEESLRESLAQLQGTAGRQNEDEVQLRELEREAAANRTLYENFLARFKQTSAQEDIQQPDAQLIAAANPPNKLSFPRRGPVIGAAFVGCFVMGFFAAFGVERLDHGFRTGEQFEKIAKVSLLGLVPSVAPGTVPQNVIIQRPVSPFAEAVRTVRTALRYTGDGEPPKVVMITSSLPEEGKSVFAVSFARSVSRSGGRAILIDCDLRRPSVAKLLKAKSKAGLQALFQGEITTEQAIQVDEESGLHFIPATGGTSNPQDLLASSQMKALVEFLRPRYDAIVLDTPPVLAVSDAVVLSHLADSSVFLVRWGRTPRSVVLGALKTFGVVGAKLSGAVLTRVDFRRHATYGYGDPGYYYGYYRNYYDGYGES